MKRRSFFLTAFLLAGGAFLWIAAGDGPTPEPPGPLPYAEAGLTEREAAVHLLSRFTYGARPGDVDRVVAMGLETWLDRQLRARYADKKLKKKLARYKALDLSALMTAHLYPNPFQMLRQAARLNGMTVAEMNALKHSEREQRIRKYLDKSGQRLQSELIAELIGQKILRAVYSQNQLAEVLADFWFNHFNVALQDGQVKVYMLSYERDAIRPHVLGSFRAMLGATAKHPAMLLYLDNAQSLAPPGVLTTVQARVHQHNPNRRYNQPAAAAPTPEDASLKRSINENYARELMELHTLGVDGGYTQRDVEEVARALTGWTYVRSYEHDKQVRELMTPRNKLLGFVREGSFFFRANAHDAREKEILSALFPAGGGLEEGERVFDLLVSHPTTSYHLTRKLAVRFVSDDPPQALVDDLAQVFRDTQGDLRAVTRAIAYSPHFWHETVRQAKVKSPFELTISALRALDAEVRPTRTLVEWIDKMGQPLYRYPAPTGFPDRAEYWINAGSLLNRMNFGLHLATGKIDGVRFDLLALNDHREPETIDAAMATYVSLLLPEGDAAATTALLLPMATDPGLAARLDASASEASAETMAGSADLAGLESGPVEASAVNPSSLARAVGVILSAPAFQRR